MLNRNSPAFWKNIEVFPLFKYVFGHNIKNLEGFLFLKFEKNEAVWIRKGKKPLLLINRRTLAPLCGVEASPVSIALFL